MSKTKWFEAQVRVRTAHVHPAYSQVLPTLSLDQSRCVCPQVTAVRPDGAYDVLFYDGDTEQKVPGRFVREAK